MKQALQAPPFNALLARFCEITPRASLLNDGSIFAAALRSAMLGVFTRL